MELTREEEAMLQGEHGYPVQKSMELLVTLGEVYGADRMVKVSHAHIVGASISIDGKGGVSYVEELASRGGKFLITATTNPSALDPFLWKEMGVSEEFFNAQMAHRNSYEKLGALMCHTCTPYDIGHVPRMGEHVVWGESSAVIFANSVLGARTNREGAPAAIAAALTGRVPLFGYHLDQNRYGIMKVVVTAKLEGIADYGSLGYFVGKIAQDLPPVFVGIPPSVSWDQLKALGAAQAASGSVALYHVVGVTPEARTEEHAFGFKKPRDSNTMEFGERELRETEEGLSKTETNEVDLIIFGCPHASISDIREIAELISGRKVHSSVDLWIQTSTPVKTYADRTGYTEIMEGAGCKIVCELCPGTQPPEHLKNMGYKAVATNSAKLAHYFPGYCDLMTHFGSTKRCVEAAITGVWR